VPQQVVPWKVRCLQAEGQAPVGFPPRGPRKLSLIAGMDGPPLVRADYPSKSQPPLWDKKAKGEPGSEGRGDALCGIRLCHGVATKTPPLGLLLEHLSDSAPYRRHLTVRRRSAQRRAKASAPSPDLPPPQRGHDTHDETRSSRYVPGAGRRRRGSPRPTRRSLRLATALPLAGSRMGSEKGVQ
jgi:hypothetical protein